MISTRLFAFLALAASCPLSQAIFTPPKILDVWSPPVYEPNSDSQWYSGEEHYVKWDTTDAPHQITNPEGTLHLVKDGRIIDLENPLAKGFSLWDGQVMIQVPMVESGVYQINLMGDSGNDSDEFQIN